MICVFRARLAGRKSGDKESGEHVEMLVHSVQGWRLYVAGPGHTVPVQQTATTSPHGTELSAVELPGGERVFFGSICWDRCLQKCSTNNARA